ncbi:MAG: OmpA family protein [Myxococcota bacterium]
MTLRSSLSALTALASLAAPWSTSARAQAPDTRFVVEQLEPQPHQGANLLNLMRSQMLRKWEPSVGLFLHYEDDPLELRFPAEDRTRVVIDSSLRAELSLGIGLFGWADLGVVMPLVVMQNGTGLDGTSLDGFALGDLRIVPRVRLLDAADGGVGLALQATVFVPTGDTATYNSEGTARVEPRLALDIHPSGTRSGLAITANVAYQPRALRRAVDFENVDALRWGAGLEVPIVEDTLSVVGVAYGSIGLGSDAGHTTPIEALGGLRWWMADDVVADLGAGAGLTSGIGSPDVRLYLSLAYTPTRDLCDGQVEDKDGFEDEDGCPDPDNDHDGILDVADGPVDASGFGACRNQPEDKDGFEDEDGCPDPDNDKDGVLDVVDGARDASGFGKCRDIPEDKDGFEDQDGCPDPDNDKDGFLDTVDGEPDASGFGKCRDLPETVNQFQDDDGCPDQLEIATVIEITEIVYFDFDRDTLQARSYPILDAVAEVIARHTELTRVRVEGHTDIIGTHAYNADLSRRRAKTVRDYLIGKGIAAERLESEGYAFDYPIATNDTQEGRDKNRRVEFVIEQIDGKPNPKAILRTPKPD